MFLEDLNWMDVESYLQQDDRVILITGATEQHAFLSLFTDIRIPRSLAAAVTMRTNVLVVPPLNFGMSAYFAAYPGTVSISQATFNQVMTEIVASLVQQGFRRMLILNGHGGNEFPAGVQQLASEHDDLKVKWHNWWQGPVAKQTMAELGHEGTHANWLENFTFTRVAESPQAEKPFLEADMAASPQAVREALGDGSFGGVYQMPDHVMQKFFDRLVDEIVLLLEEWD